MSSLRLTPQLQQRMVLTPQLRQRIEMLQMTSLELNDLIEREMVSNPVLEEVQPGEEAEEMGNDILDLNADGTGSDEGRSSLELQPEIADVGSFENFDALTPAGSELNGSADVAERDADDESSGESSDSFDEIDYGREFQDYLDPGYRTQEIEYKEDAPSFEQFLSAAPSLIEHLEWQLNLLRLDEYHEEAAFQIVGNLDEDGRLNSTIEELAESCGCTTEVVERSRQVVMQLDPIGCGAFNVKECLLAQVAESSDDAEFLRDLIGKHFEDLQPHRLSQLARTTGVDVHVLDDAIQKIKLLDPYPGRRYSSEEPVFVSPEVYIEKIDEEYVIFFADDGGPRLRISQMYHSMLDQSSTTKETKDFIREKVRGAIDLLRNIEHRRQTIYRVVESIVARQRAFLDHGVQHIKPMMLKDIAEDIGMHLSTISRVVNRKYAHTPQGVIELRRFFSEGMMNEEGEEVSTRILKLRIKKLVEEEDSKKPLTDDEITKVLGKEGVKLSRRTIAKYRDQMNIPGSRERKTII
jgi:RNA polymerase sigma-54 factor